MRSIDLNADTGEADNHDWRLIENRVLAQVSSANIACGGHAGDDESMKRILDIAKPHNINIGAHPAYPDRENFGRKTMSLGEDISLKGLENALLSQIARLAEIAVQQGQNINYVKAHGALYNDAVFDPEKADLFAGVVASLDTSLWLMGAPDSQLTRAAHRHGLSFVAEGFVDRRYTDDGHLQSRKVPGAVIEKQLAREAQASALLLGQTVQTASGGELALKVDTLCLHSDSPGADETARRIRQNLEAQGARIKAFTRAP